jgi:hypothetical protein
MILASATLNDTIAALEARLAELRKELARHPLARELAILAEAVEKLRQLPGTGRAESPEIAPPLPLSFPRSAGKRPRATILDAAEQIVMRAPHPLSTREIVAVLAQTGVVVGGANPASNLSSTLSKRAKRLRSIGHRKNARWWPIDRPLPSETLQEAAE